MVTTSFLTAAAATVALMLLTTGRATWAFSTSPALLVPRWRSTTITSSSYDNLARTTLRMATMDKPMLQRAAINEARQCLMEIEECVNTARTYLKYLEDIAEEVASYVESLEEGTDGSSLPTFRHANLPELKDASSAKEYLVNIQTAATAAEDYMSYLEGVAASVRLHLSKMESVTQEEEFAEQKTRGLLEELEETARAAKEYLLYLKGVANAVEAFLADPSSPPPPELANLNGISSATAEQPTGGGSGIPSYLDSVSSSSTSLPSFGNGFDGRASTPPGGAEGGGTGNYLDNIGSSSARTGGSGMPSFANSLGSATAPAAAAMTPPPPVAPKAVAEEAKPAASSAPTSTPKTTTSPKKKPSSYSGSASSTAQKSYLEAISGRTSPIKGSGIAQKTYADTLTASSARSSSGKKSNKPTGYLSSIDQSRGERKKPTYAPSAGVTKSQQQQDSIGAHIGNIFFLLVVVAAIAGYFTDGFTNFPEGFNQLDGIANSWTSVVDQIQQQIQDVMDKQQPAVIDSPPPSTIVDKVMEKIGEEAPKVVEQVTPPVDVTPPLPPADITPPLPPADVTPPLPSADVTPPSPPVDVTPPPPPVDVTPPSPPVDVTPPLPPVEVAPPGEPMPEPDDLFEDWKF